MRYIKDGIIYNEVKYVELNEMGISNPSHEQILEAGYEVYVEPEPSPEELLENAKNTKISQITEYDMSEEVNAFYLGETQMWLDKETRASLKLRFESEESVGRTTTTLWYNNICYTLHISDAKLMLTQLEVYASDCYDITAQHKANVCKLTTVKEVEDYDHTVGYPEKLHFDYE